MRDTGFEQLRPARRLPAIPVFEVDAPGSVHLMDLAADRLDALLADGRKHYGNLVLAAGDAFAWGWLSRTANPYLGEIAAVRRQLGRPGAVMLNMSYEWSCTAGVGPDPAGRGCRLLRTLDWPMNGLGRNVVVAVKDGGAGPYWDVTWPGYVGVLTAMAPGRFSAAINQPPLRWRTGLLPVDWVFGRVALWRAGGLPPTHLLRRVFDTCRTYAEARQMIAEEPLALPAFFSLAGVSSGEGCVIERLEKQAVVHEAPTGIANHWRGFLVRGHDRGHDSSGRLAAMVRVLPSAGDDFDWAVSPTINQTTRLVVSANAARSFLAVQGWERNGPATAVLVLSSHGRVSSAAATVDSVTSPTS
jgi:hypothetical protein